MNKEEFNALRLKAREEIDFTDENYFYKTMQIPRLLQYYTDLSLKQKSLYYSIEEKKAKKYKELYRKYKFDDDIDWATKEEVKIQIEGDDNYLKILRSMEWQKIIIEFIDRCINNIKTMGYSLKQYHDIKLLKNGFIK